MSALQPARPEAGRTIGLVLLLGLVWSIAACDRDDDQPEAAAVAAAESLAAQPDRPLVPDEEVESSEVSRLDPATRAEAGLTRPVDIEHDGGGNLYVLDNAERSRILKFDPTGGFLFPFNRLEPDVDRIGRATDLAVAPWNTILLVDRENNVLVSFLTSGTYASSTQIHGIAMDVLPVSSFGEFYLHKWDPATRRAYVVHMRAPIDSLGAPYSVGIPSGQNVRKEARDVAFRTAVDARDRLYVAFADAYPVRVVDPDGSTVRLVGVDRPPLQKSPALIEEERERNYREIDERLPDISNSLKLEAAEPTPTLPMIEELVVDPSGRLWVRTHRSDPAERMTDYDVFNAEGDFLARVRIPGEIRRTAFAPGGRLTVIDAASDASREIVGYEVRFGPVARPDGDPSSGEASTSSPGAVAGERPRPAYREETVG